MSQLSVIAVRKVLILLAIFNAGALAWGYSVSVSKYMYVRGLNEHGDEVYNLGRYIIEVYSEDLFMPFFLSTVISCIACIVMAIMWPSPERSGDKSPSGPDDLQDDY